MEFLLDFPLGKEVRNFQVFTRKFQLLEGNFKDFKSQFLTWKENKSTLHYCSSVGGKKSLKAVSAIYLAIFYSFKMLIYAAVFLRYINLRWTLTIQQKIYN